MFRTDLLSIIRSLDTVFTAAGICHNIYVNCLIVRLTSLADSHHNCCEYSIKIPDDGLSRSETCTVVYQSKVEK